MKSWDVIVIGSGAAGFAAAVTACCKGLSVLMLEKAGQFGGTSSGRPTSGCSYAACGRPDRRCEAPVRLVPVAARPSRSSCT